MSKKLDPKDLAIQFVMTAPIDAAVTFVETLGAVVKARAKTAAAMTAARTEQRKATDTTSPARPRSRAALRDVKIVDPSAPATDEPTAAGQLDLSGPRATDEARATS